MSIITLAPPHLEAGIAGPDPVPTDALADLVVGLAHAPELWRPAVPTRDGERSGVRLLETAALDVWLLVWPPGTQVEPHDHGASAGAFSVVEGALTELRWSGARRSQMVSAGMVVTIEAGVVHDVIATAEQGTSPAVSIHAYSPPLRTMGFYADDGASLVAEVVVDSARAHW